MRLARAVPRWLVLGALLHSLLAAPASGPRQWRVMELTFTSSSNYANPMTGVQFSALFTGPGNLQLRIPGFWDGGRIWKVRFAPTAAGEWSYQTLCGNLNDAGLHGRRDTFSVAASAGPNPIYLHGGFLKASANQRHLMYSDGTPFFWLGDTWWFAPSYLVPHETFQTLIEARKRQNYSVVQMAFWGGFEFFTEAFFYQPQYWGNDQIKVWRQIDKYFETANEAGIIPVIGTFWGSYWDFYGLRLDNLKLQWRYLVSRYGAFAVSWLICGEFNAPQPAATRQERIASVLELARFVKDADPYQRAMSVHPHPGDERTAGGRRQEWREPWHDFIMLQGGHSTSWETPPVDFYLKAYHGAIRKPMLESECKYEGIHGMQDDMVRHAAYRAIQSGSFGYTYGAQGLWFPIWSPDRVPESVSPAWGKPVLWPDALALPGGAQMKHLRSCYEAVEWWKLEPRPEAVTCEAELEERERILTKAEGQRTFLVYFPKGGDPAGRATLHGGAPELSYRASWFNPRSGTWHLLSGNLAMPQGKCLLPVRPDRQDWMLIVQAKP